MTKLSYSLSTPAAHVAFLEMACTLVGIASGLSFIHKGHVDDAIHSENSLPVHLLDLSKEVSTTAFDWNLCNTSVHSNLGGLGPDGGDENLRFGPIAYYMNTAVDLVIRNQSEYIPHNVSRDTARGCFGVINLAKGTSVDLLFEFVRSGTEEPVHLQGTLYFSVFDLDCSASGCEHLIMKSPVPDKFYVDPSSELEMGIADGGGMSFRASSFGTGADNPPPLDALQKARGVSFQWSASIPRFELTYSAHSRVGRNFLFAGKTVLVPPEKGTTTTTTIPGEEKCFNCIVWGDPHVITFDASKKRSAQHPIREALFRTHNWKNDQVSIYDEGTFWLVRSKRVLIQARYWHNQTHQDWTDLGALAVGGPFLGNNTLIIRSLSGASTWNGNEILSQLPSNFKNDYVHASYHRDSELVQNGNAGPGIDITLPEGVRLTVNRWKQNLAVKIGMCPQMGGQDGQCGTYNGVSSDDSANMQRVNDSNFLF